MYEDHIPYSSNTHSSLNIRAETWYRLEVHLSLRDGVELVNSVWRTFQPHIPNKQGQTEYIYWLNFDTPKNFASPTYRI